MQLTEKYRPRVLADVIGQQDTITALQTLQSRGLHSSAFYFHGPSGTGKTTIARALVNALHIDERDVTMIGGADCLKAVVQDTIQNFAYSAWGDSQWKAVIVDECHAMSETAVQVWLPYLESLPKRRIVIFTTTEAPAVDMFGQFTMPLLSRCKVFELQADHEAFAQHAAKIAAEENLNGRPIAEYRNLIESCGGNLRAALQQIETGRMLRPFEAPITAKQAMRLREFIDGPIPPAIAKLTDDQVLTALGDTRIADELERGKKFFAGSKKHAAHLERLKALRSERI